MKTRPAVNGFLLLAPQSHDITAVCVMQQFKGKNEVVRRDQTIVAQRRRVLKPLTLPDPVYNANSLDLWFGSLRNVRLQEPFETNETVYGDQFVVITRIRLTLCPHPMDGASCYML